MNKFGWPIALFALLALLLLLGACTSLVGQANVSATNIVDTALDTAIYTKCKAATVGSIERRYMQHAAAWELWYQECRGAGALRVPVEDAR